MDKKKKIIALALTLGVLAVAATYISGGFRSPGFTGLSSSVLSEKAPSAMSDTEIDTEMSRLTLALEEYPTAIRLEEQRLATAVGQIDGYQRDVAKFNEVCDAKKEEKRVAEEALAALIDTWIPLKFSLDTLLGQKWEKTSKIGDKTTVGSNLWAIENNTKDVIPDLIKQQKGLARTSDEYKRLAGLITAAKSENTRLTGENKTLTAQIKKLEPDIRSAELALNDTYKYLKDTYELDGATKARYEREIGSTTIVDSNLWKIENNKTVVIPGLKGQQNGLKTTSTEYKALTTQISNVNKENARLTARNTALRGMIAKLTTKITAQEKPTSRYSQTKAAVAAQEARVNAIVLPADCGRAIMTQGVLDTAILNKGAIEQSLSALRENKNADENRMALLIAQQERRFQQDIEERNSQMQAAIAQVQAQQAEQARQAEILRTQNLDRCMTAAAAEHTEQWAVASDEERQASQEIAETACQTMYGAAAERTAETAWAGNDPIVGDLSLNSSTDNGTDTTGITLDSGMTDDGTDGEENYKNGECPGWKVIGRVSGRAICGCQNSACTYDAEKQECGRWEGNSFWEATWKSLKWEGKENLPPSDSDTGNVGEIVIAHENTFWGDSWVRCN